MPSHDTFSTVLRMIDPKALDAAFAGLAAKLVAALADNGVIAIDGKVLKGAYDKGKSSEAEMMVSAYATGLRMTLATVAAEKRNEVGAALGVLDLIDLKGKLVTADSLHCNRKMAAKTKEKGGDYCLTAIDLMHAVVPLAERLARLPAQDGATTPHAGLSFTHPRSITPVHSTGAARTISAERLAQIAQSVTTAQRDGAGRIEGVYSGGERHRCARGARSAAIRCRA